MVAAIHGLYLLATVVTAMVVRNCVKPRLPAYSIRIFDHSFLHFGTSRLAAKLQTQVKLKNENLINVDIHAINFDFYYEGLEGNLNHLGTVRDVETAKPAFVTPNPASPSTETGADGEKEEKRRRRPALWRIKSRSEFMANDEIYLHANLGALLRSTGHLVSHWIRGKGRLVIPTVGVAHIRASTPWTITMVCDNMVDTWSLHVEGLECSLLGLKTGWTDLETAAAKLRHETVRDYQLSKRIRTAGSSGLLPQELETSSNGGQSIFDRVEWEEAMQML